MEATGVAVDILRLRGLSEGYSEQVCVGSGFRVSEIRLRVQELQGSSGTGMIDRSKESGSRSL